MIERHGLSRRPRQDSGAGTVLVLAATALLMAAAVIFTGVVTAAALHQRTVTAADLAAIAGATHPEHACAWAERIARAHGVRLDDCVMSGRDVLVSVSVALPTILQRLAGSNEPPRITARARAGPS